MVPQRKPLNGISSIVSHQQSGSPQSLLPDAGKDLSSAPADSNIPSPSRDYEGERSFRGEATRTTCADSSGCRDGEGERGDLPLPALRDYWEELYEQELHLASPCGSECGGDAEESLSGEGTDPDDSADSDTTTVYEGNGEEWFEAQSEAIANWLLSKTQELFSEGRVPSAASGNAGVELAANSETEEGTDAATRHLQIPILDVGCGNGIFLLRLLRRGFTALAGVDYSAAAIQLARQNVSRVLHRKKHRQRRRKTLRARESSGQTVGDQRGEGCHDRSLLSSTADMPEAVVSYRFPHVCLALVDLRKVSPLGGAGELPALSGAKSPTDAKAPGWLCRVYQSARRRHCVERETRRAEKAASDSLNTASHDISNDTQESDRESKRSDGTDSTEKEAPTSERWRELKSKCRDTSGGVERVGRLFWCCGEAVEGGHKDSEPLSILHALPQFPIIHDKGTFDVFYLLKIPKVYVQRIWALLPARGLLCLTSCNCTREELESFFCERENGDKPFFQVLDQLRHKAFKFGGVEGQIVTTLMFARADA
ncbi:methyltransferase domain protein [Toxoplasma gondii TgCatPRC2]|uniref:Protein-lysine N-methyltransferase TGPRC2_249010 n=1 Tax=Toxoplasma gondii TgCatPRC2 TaxID=1130821 RepID=A0A151HFL7_TOXGO|nr:methyltransferase domain protein [Toxoplasma gondii TgCatPRC2]